MQAQIFTFPQYAVSLVVLGSPSRVFTLSVMRLNSENRNLVGILITGVKFKLSEVGAPSQDTINFPDWMTYQHSGALVWGVIRITCHPRLHCPHPDMVTISHLAMLRCHLYFLAYLTAATELSIISSS